MEDTQISTEDSEAVPAAKPKGVNAMVAELGLEKPRRQRRKNIPPVYYKSGRFWNLSDNIILRFADTGKFHTMAEILAMLNAELVQCGEEKLALAEHHIKPAIRAIDGRKDVHLETRKAAKGQRHYKFFRQGKMIGLSVLKAKFKPVIDDLKAQAALPISHQSSGRFHAAAGALAQILRDLEA